MKKHLGAVSLLAAMLAVLGSTCSAASEYVIVNNNNPHENSLSVYKLHTPAGVLAEVAVLSTGGARQVTIAVNPNVEQATTADGRCLFAMDGGTSDIASFSAATGYSEVGRYTDPSLAADYSGGSLALTPNGAFMYASYSQTENIGAWEVNPDCSLTFIAAYVPSGGVGAFYSLGVTPNGGGLVVPLGDRAELFRIDPNTGTLADVGFASFAGEIEGLDFTKDSKVVVFAGSVNGRPSGFFAEITPSGLVNPRVVYLKNSASVSYPTFPFFSAAGYAGSGKLYFGARGNGGPGYAGVITTNFSEKPPALTVINATPTNAPGQGPIVASGDVMVVAEDPNVIGVFSINLDGSLTQLSTAVDSRAQAPFSLSVFPNTR